MNGRTTLVGVDQRTRFAGKALTIGTLVLLLSAFYLLLISVLAPRLDTPWLPLGHTLAAVMIATLVVPIRNRLALGYNRLLHREWQTSQMMLRDIGASLSHTLSPEGLHSILVDDLPQRLRVQGATLWMLEPPDERTFVLVGQPNTASQPLLVNGVIARRLMHATYLLIPTADRDIDWTPLIEQGVRLVLPLRAGHQLVGIIKIEGGIPLGKRSKMEYKPRQQGKY